MRVIAGSARGLALVAPRGDATRPISDRVKETLFGILAERVPGAAVIDLYAGSGAIGIEALSRGAERATFVERDHAALVALRANLQRTSLTARSAVESGDVLRVLEGGRLDRYDLAFLDPPYATHAILAPLERLLPHLVPGATVVVKHFWRTELPVVAPLHAWRTRRFGETALTFLETDGAPEP